MAAARLGLRCQVFSPDPDSPAFDVVLHATCAEYADVEALELFAADVDIITYEFENVPAASAMILAARRPVLPDRKILETTQDRLAEKDFVKRLGIGTADYADVSSAATLAGAIAAHRPARRDQDPAASDMTARARPSSAPATIRTRSGRTSPPNRRFSRPLLLSSARSR